MGVDSQGRCDKHFKPTNSAGCCEDCISGYMDDLAQAMPPKHELHWAKGTLVPVKVQVFGGDYHIHLTPDARGGLKGEVLEFPCCVAYGDGLIEAVAHLMDALHKELTSQGGLRYIKLTMSVDDTDFHEMPKPKEVEEE